MMIQLPLAETSLTNNKIQGNGQHQNNINLKGKEYEIVLL